MHDDSHDPQPHLGAPPRKHLLAHDASPSEEQAHEHDEGPPPEFACQRRALFSCIVLTVAALIVVVAFVLRSTSSAPNDDGPPASAAMPQCTHPIYCTGPLLAAVQLGNIFPDCKTFVDMPMLYPAEVILANFSKHAATGLGFNLTAFVLDHFDPPGSELVPAAPSDFIPYPPAYSAIRDPKLRQFAYDVHAIWPQLFRRHDASKYGGQAGVSSILVNNPFIVPGGRFREFYYWDTYWIVRGLLTSGMTNSTRDILLNVLGIVEQYGFMPNGGRVYYGGRSQPPLLTQMVQRYVDATNDETFLAYALPILDQEHSFWMATHTINDYNQSHILSRYNVQANAPRPESYREDLATMRGAGRSPSDIYSNLAAGAETGWDFCSRFLENGLNLSTIATTDIAPVDLNAILLMNEESLKNWYNGVPFASLRNATKRLQYDVTAEGRTEAILFHLFDPFTGFHDKNMKSGTLQKQWWYPSDVVPLLTSGAANRLDLFVIERIADSILLEVGGVPTSLAATGQQWDYPNAWAPLQMFAVEALTMVAGVARKKDKARFDAKRLTVVQAWIDTTYCGFHKHQGMMFEKYNVLQPGEPGGGGEYTVQAGFGWTNGVVLEMLAQFGDALNAPLVC